MGKRIPHNKGKMTVDWQTRVDTKFAKDPMKIVSIGESDSRGERRLTLQCLNCGNIVEIPTSTLRQTHRPSRCIECQKVDTVRIRDAEKEQAKEQRKLDWWTSRRHIQIGFSFLQVRAVHNRF